MVILLTGATGFLGGHLSRALLAAGHEVIQVRRDGAFPTEQSSGPQTETPRLRHVLGDLATDHRVSDWLARLRGVDVVVNAAGILRESPGQTFQAVHVRGPCALFDACVQAGVRRVVQVSALGADEAASSGYHLSKRVADEYLLGLPVCAVVVQPSLIFGSGGTSAYLFCRLAVLPVVPVPGRGEQLIQPLHVNDAVRAMLALLGPRAPRGRLPLVGPAALSLKDFLLTLRGALGLPPARVLSVPEGWVDMLAKAASWRRRALLDADTWSMLRRGNIGDAGPVCRLLGEAPRPATQFVGPDEAPARRATAQLGWLLPMLRLALATVWLVTAYVSLAVFPRDESLALLVRSGVPAAWAPLFLWGAALLDLLLGIATLALHRWRPLWLVQAALIAFYTMVITLRLPEYWAHPFGPLLKNLPVLAMLWVLYELAPRAAPSRRPEAVGR